MSGERSTSVASRPILCHKALTEAINQREQTGMRRASAVGSRGVWFRGLCREALGLGEKACEMLHPGQSVLIRADHREAGSATLEGLRAIEYVDLQVEQLDVGDYVLSPQVVVERKSAPDLVASILDKRLFSQVERLKQAYERVVYLVEGESLYEASNVHPNAIRGALSFLVVLNEVSLFRSEGPEDSAMLLATMARHAQHGLGYEVSEHAKRRSVSPHLQMRYLVEDLPGIGPKTAHGLLTAFGTLRALFAAREEALREVPGIGPKRAGQIHRLLTREYTP